MTKPLIAIACGGTGGHLFPGVAIAEEFLDYDVDVLLIVRQGDVERFGVSVLSGAEIREIPGVRFSLKTPLRSLSDLVRNARAVKTVFRERPPAAVLGMGGYSSFSPIRQARKLGVPRYLHEANSVPGRAVRMLAKHCHKTFTFFDCARRSIESMGGKAQRVGMPLRRQFERFDAPSSRLQLGLRRDQPTLLVMGGSQGARPINRFVSSHLDALLEAIPNLQIIHLSGSADFEEVKAAYKRYPNRGVVRPFLTEMEFAYAAANAVFMRSGASTLAEVSRMRTPTILTPLPHAADGHQRRNATEFAKSGAARVIEQSDLEIGRLIDQLRPLLFDGSARDEMIRSLADWDAEDATESIVTSVLEDLGLPTRKSGPLIRFD